MDALNSDICTDQPPLIQFKFQVGLAALENLDSNKDVGTRE